MGRWFKGGKRNSLEINGGKYIGSWSKNKKMVKVHIHQKVGMYMLVYGQMISVVK